MIRIHMTAGFWGMVCGRSFKSKNACARGTPAAKNYSVSEHSREMKISPHSKICTSGYTKISETLWIGSPMIRTSKGPFVEACFPIGIL